MKRFALSLSLATLMLAVGSASAADNAAITIYGSNNDSLFMPGTRGGIASGMALVHEERQLTLQDGRQVVTLDGLPDQIDAEALQLHFPDRDDVQLLSSRLLLPEQAGLLASQRGKGIEVIGDSGQVLASGTLIDTHGGLLVRNNGGLLVLVHKYAAVRMTAAVPRTGLVWQQTLATDHAGTVSAKLDYPTAGLGWRAIYHGLLQGEGDNCSLQLQSHASIANRSGVDWPDAELKLVAGQPNFATQPGGGRYLSAMAAPTLAEAKALPKQDAMGSYQSFTLDGATTLPAGSITQMPLYAAQTLACQRRYVLEYGHSWWPRQPLTTRSVPGNNDGGIRDELGFKAFDSLPAGYFYASGLFDGHRQLLGQARVADTPKGQTVHLVLGEAFNLRGERERTRFELDKAAHRLREAFRITVSNGGDQAREVTVRIHPTRWQQWTLESSSEAPTRKTSEMLEFTLAVPAHADAGLDYALRYQWTAADE